MKKFFLTLVGALLLTGGAAFAQSETFIEALKFYNMGATQNAVALLRKEISVNPENDAAYFYLASALMNEKGKKDVAQIGSLLKKASDIDPDNYWYKHTLALFYMRTEQPELASVLLEDLIKKYPKKSSLYFDTANAYLQQDDLNNAMAAIDKVEAITGKNEMLAITKMDLIDKLNPKDQSLAYKFLEEYYKDCKTEKLASMLGDYYHAIYQDSLALDYYNQSLTINDTYSPAYYGRAHCWQDLRQYDKYFIDINRFLTDKNLDSEVKAEYLQKVSRVPQMARAFQPEIDTLMLNTYAVHPGDTTLSYVVAIWYYETNRQKEAMQTMKTCVNFHPDCYKVAYQYMLLQYYSQDWNNLTESASIFIQRFPQEDESFIIRAGAFYALKEYQSALEDYQTVYERHPKDSATIVTTCQAMADIYYQMGEPNTAFKLYQKVLKVNPEDVGTLNNYAYFLSLQGKNLKKAKEMSQKSIQKEPKNPTYLDTYAWILHKMGNNLEAKAMFKQALLYGGKTHPEILEHYAEVLQDLGESELAKIYMNQAKALK